MATRKLFARSERFNDDQLGQIRSVVTDGLEQIVLPRLDTLCGDVVELKRGQARLEQGQAELRKNHNELFAQVQRMDDKLVEMDDKLTELIAEVKAIKKQLTRFITREEYEELKKRVIHIERQLKIG